MVRNQVGSFYDRDTGWKARYPPRNLLNSKFLNGPRDKQSWVSTATYYEPPFPIIKGTAACSAMRNFAIQHTDLTESINVLDVLKAIFEDMGNRQDACDQ